MIRLFLTIEPHIKKAVKLEIISQPSILMLKKNFSQTISSDLNKIEACCTSHGSRHGILLV